jgi:catechol 2,3-dioxygenase-like lactoylglutathione lyase family enzyme
MIAFEYILLFVRDITVSTQFYKRLLECDPLALSPTFVRFPLSPGAQLELWQSDKVDPPSDITGGGMELGIAVADADAVARVFDDWEGKGVTFAQRLTTMGFGRTFVALDPDGHRLRVAVLGP